MAWPDVAEPKRLIVVVDTSGSMSDGMLGQALGEVRGVLRSLGVARRDLRIICCDAEAYEAQEDPPPHRAGRGPRGRSTRRRPP